MRRKNTNAGLLSEINMEKEFFVNNWAHYYFQRVITLLRVDATKNYLGFAVWIIEPALTMIVFYLVFGVFFQRGGEGFAPFLLVGIVAWLWFASSVSRCMVSILGARQMMSQVYIPKLIFPIVELSVCAVKQLVVFTLLLLFLLAINGANKEWMFFPLIVCVQMLLILAVGLWVSAIVPFVPDLRVFVPPGLQMLMFCSGVFYSVDMMPDSVKEYFLLNPVANLIFQYRLVLLEGERPQFGSLAIIGGASLCFILTALLFLKRFDRIYPRLVI